MVVYNLDLCSWCVVRDNYNEMEHGGIPMKAPPEEKQRMLELALEMRGYVENMQQIQRQSKHEKDVIIERMQEIGAQMKDFRKRYPFD